ncbi:type II toxin-antitoxin system HipA family toxin [Undibacterium sp. FT79W]|uniref:type II toxin-antitoxin system HipA family toxin n=1 Tax=Undibacterium sp. FT79W TaxID=2762296 RepID=UPI00164B47D8|nr:type II toxin-antitoxin system HipA family toxin [Undibacterium sp. FT79W]MBC3879538.1 type II toxin-antitoxin system HipA family toxin [Undibacterium sp. FT79W]
MKKLNINFCGWGQNWHLGTLAHEGRTLLFEYSDEALARGIELSPIYLKLRKVAYSGFPVTQDNLPGLIADSLPDGWGRLLMDRCFQKSGRDPGNISPLDRLAFISDRAMGALVFTPPDALSHDPEYQELRVLAEGAQLILAGKDTTTLEQLALTGGSPHGAQPKVLVQYNTSTEEVSTDRAAPGEAWLVKFQAQGEAKEVCAIEILYATMARQCGLDMPGTKYFDLTPKLAGFGIERFDRRHGMRVPTLSLAALLDDNFRLPTRDYEVFLRATRTLTKDDRQVKNAFERCVFNVVFNNRDDHTKNFAYVMNESMHWELAPCFDLTYNVGIGGEHQMTIRGEGRNPGHEHLLALAKAVDLPSGWARQTIERITSIAGTLATYAKDVGIKPATLRVIKSAIEANRRRMV